MSAFEAALAYRARGWSVMPTDGKRPHAAALLSTSSSTGWKRLRQQPASKTEIEEWYERFPDAGVAILTGRPSGLVVADFDRRIPPSARLAETPLVRSGRGVHVYLHSDGRVSTSKFPGGDLKAEGGYVVAPPSLHPSGTAYQWLIAPEGLGTLAVPEAAVADFAELEQWGLPVRTERGWNTGVDIYSCVPSSREGDEDDLARWDCDPAFVDAARARLGILQRRLGQTFRCVLPGHEEEHPSASLFVEPRRQLVVYRDWHTNTWYTLAEVYAAQVSGRVGKLHGPTLARWKLRLLVELGFLTPAPVSMPSLPVGAPATARAVYEGFQLLLACRWIREPGEPTPFTGEFGAGWCGLSPSRFAKGKKWLNEQRLIDAAGTYRRMRLWLPGRGEGV